MSFFTQRYGGEELCAFVLDINHGSHRKYKDVVCSEANDLMSIQ